MKRSMLVIAKLIAVTALLAGCAGGPGGTFGPTPAPTAPAGGPLSQAELRYRLIDAFGPLWYCDPDIYPVARADEQQLALQRFGEVQADREAFTAILSHLG